jgi:hypothetical protein
MALFLRIVPHDRQYRLPRGEEAGEVTKSLAEVIGSDGCVVIGYDLPDQPRANAIVVLNGRSLDAVELIEVPDEED